MNKKLLSTAILALTLLAASLPATAGNLQIKVFDERQLPLDYAVVYINEKAPPATDTITVIDQVDKEFIPYVTAVQRGSSINFLNNDDIRHQVYSFSEPKQFEIPLFRDNPERPVLFDQAGAVPIACNIHDWMTAYIYVVDTSKFVVTDTNGTGSISGLADGSYEVLVWHPKLDGSAEATAQEITINGGDQSLTFNVTQKPVLRAWRAPTMAKRKSY